MDMRATAKRIGIAAMVTTTTLIVVAAVLGTGIAAGARKTASQQASAPTNESPAATSTVAATPASASAPLANPVVILYGDSLAWEAEDSFVGAFAGKPGVQVLTRTYGGTAICDWFDAMRSDAATLAPGAVVLEFSGNALTPCMEDADGHGLTGNAYWEHYRADAQTAISFFAPAHSRVYLAGAPISRVQEATGDFHGGLVNAMYDELASLYGDVVAYVDAGASVLDHGHWTPTLPCLPNEPCTGGTDLRGRGINVVRAPDGGHFCPAAEEAKRGVVAACPIWSSGAFRYGNAMAAPVLAHLGS
jgi:hypothetical protein